MAYDIVVPGRSGWAVVVELDVIEGNQVVLDEWQAREALSRLVSGRVVEQEDRAGPVGLEEDVADQAFGAEHADLPPLGLQVRGDVLACEVADNQNFHCAYPF